MNTGTGTGRLIRFALRRDRVWLPVWIVSLVTLAGYSAAQVNSLYATPLALRGYVATFSDNPALVLFSGPGYGFASPSVGAILVNETSLWMAVGCALMSAFHVVRHTRAEEESERADLLRSAVVGRYAPLAATLVVTALSNALVAGGCIVAFIIVGFPVAGSIALGTSFGLVGITFAAAAAVTAQIGSTARGVRGLACAAVGIAFLIRGIGDVSAPAMSWLTPFGWGIGIRAFAVERWWTLLGLLGMAVAMTVVALRISDQRDLGSGLLRERRGPSAAKPWVTTPVGLAWRLQRAAIVAWCIGVICTGYVFGMIGRDVDAMLADNPQLADYLTQLEGASPVDAYLATSAVLIALMTTGFAVSSMLRLRGDEAAGRAEAVLATPISRRRWLGAHLIVTMVGTTLVTAGAGLGTGLGYAITVGDAGQLPRLLGAALVTLPAVLVLVGVALLLFGCLPRLAQAAWAGVAAVVAIGVFGSVLQLPRWIRALSPFEHGARVPAQAFAPRPLLGLIAVFILLAAIGIAGFERRDMAGA